MILGRRELSNPLLLSFMGKGKGPFISHPSSLLPSTTFGDWERRKNTIDASLFLLFDSPGICWLAGQAPWKLTWKEGEVQTFYIGYRKTLRGLVIKILLCECLRICTKITNKTCNVRICVKCQCLCVAFCKVIVTFPNIWMSPQCCVQNVWRFLCSPPPV